jgi:ribosomal protein S18 acetylase RimI-like enzyme
MVAEIVVPTSVHEHIRRLDVRRDLARVADLVEMCFSDTLDPEGRQYLNEMRRAAQAASMMRVASSLIEDTAYLPSGYIWEEDEQLVGNLSLIPINLHGKRGYMIANVATHPEHRGRGIATALTITALRYAEGHGAAGVWLQVRDDNPTAIHIYEMNGFTERLRRTSWYSGPSYELSSTPTGVRVLNRQSRHWPLQRTWLTRLYPADLTWNIPFDWNLFRPDLWGLLYRTFSLEYLRHWSVEHNNELRGTLSWKHSRGYADNLWLAVPEPIDEQATEVLLTSARSALRMDQPLRLNYPAGAAVNILRKAGFYPQQTLIWMSIDLKR